MRKVEPKIAYLASRGNFVSCSEISIGSRVPLPCLVLACTLLRSLYSRKKIASRVFVIVKLRAGTVRTSVRFSRRKEKKEKGNFSKQGHARFVKAYSRSRRSRFFEWKNLSRGLMKESSRSRRALDHNLAESFNAPRCLSLSL